MSKLKHIILFSTLVLGGATITTSCDSGPGDDVAKDLTFSVYGYTSDDLASTGTADMPTALNPGDVLTLSNDIFNDGNTSYTLTGSFQLVIDEINGSSENSVLTIPQVYERNNVERDIATFTETEAFKTVEANIIANVDAAVESAIAAGATGAINTALETTADFDDAVSFINLTDADRNIIHQTIRNLGYICIIDEGTIDVFGGGGGIYVRSVNDTLLTSFSSFQDIANDISAGITPTITGSAENQEVWHQIAYTLADGDTHYGVAYYRINGNVVNYVVEDSATFTITLNGDF